MRRFVLLSLASISFALVAASLRAGVIAPPPVPVTLNGTSPSPPFYERVGLDNWLNFDAEFTNNSGHSLLFEEGSVTFLDEEGTVTGSRAITSAQLYNSLVVNASDGSPARSRFQKGWLTTNLDSRTERIEAMARDRNGNFVAVGWGDVDGRDRIYVVRYLEDGELDTSFSGDGQLSTTFPELDHVQASDVAVTPDNRIVVVGTGRNRGDSARYMVVVKYRSDGRRDNSFDGDGRKAFVLGFERSECEAVLVDSSGRIVLGGSVDTPRGGRDFAVARLHPDGSFDSSFGFAGATNVDFNESSADKVYDLAFDRSGRIVAVGSTAKAGVIKFAVARLTPAGDLDNSFSNDGKSAPNFFASPGEFAKCVAVDFFGGLVVGGVAMTGQGMRFAVARFQPNGFLDPNFDGNGKAITPIFNTKDSWAEDIIFDGARIVAAGIAQDGTRDWLTLVAYRADGSLDSSFHQIGIAAIERENTVDEGATSILRGPRGLYYVGGHADALDEDGISRGLRFALTRFHGDGELDTRFIVPVGARVMWRWPYPTFPRKASPARFNVQLRFDEFASPFYMTFRPQHHEQNHQPYIFPLRTPSYQGGEWNIGFCHQFDSAHRRHSKFINGIHRNNQRYAYDISLQVAGKALKPGEDSSLNESRYSYNEPIIAAADGVVVFVQDGVDENDPGSKLPGVPGGGNMVRIDHGNGEYSMYAHMIPGSITVTRGQFVQQGQVIGRLGNSGNSSGPHLHFHLMTLWDATNIHPDGIPVYFKNVGFPADDRNHQLRCGLPAGLVTIGQPLLDEPVPLGNPAGPGSIQESEPNDSFGEAQWIQAPCAVHGVLSPGDGGEIVDGGDVIEDIYRLDVERAGWMSFRIEPTERTDADLDLVVFDRRFMAHRPEAGTSNASSEIFSAELVPGTYYVLVSAFDGKPPPDAVSYQLEIERLQPFSGGVGGLTLGGVEPERIAVDWIVAEDVEGTSFTLERRPANDNRFQAVTDLSEAGSGFVDEDVSDGKDYVYRIRVENEFGDVEYTEEVVLSTKGRIDAVYPDSGPSRGGTEVTLLGVNFTEDASFSLGGAALVDVVWISPNEVRGVTGPHASGTVDVEVVTAFGAAALAGGFEYTDADTESFRRGDINQDGVDDITDGLVTLDYLFLGNAVIHCLKAADFDDNGEIDITDPITSLAHQFLGGPPPAPPGKDVCGFDPTEDRLSCERFDPCR